MLLWLANMGNAGGQAISIFPKLFLTAEKPSNIILQGEKLDDEDLPGEKPGNIPLPGEIEGEF